MLPVDNAALQLKLDSIALNAGKHHNLHRNPDIADFNSWKQSPALAGGGLASLRF